MLAIFCVTLLLLCTLSSVGYALCALCALEPRNPFLPFFLGILVVSLLGMALSLFVPLGLVVSLLCFAPALPGLVPLVCRGRRAWQAGPRQCVLWVLAVCCLAGLFSFAAAWAVWPGIAIDTDLYHTPIVRWLNEYGTVPGVGNLHSRLANTSAWLVVAALLNHGVLQGSTAWYVTPLFLTAFSLFLAYEAVCGRLAAARAYALCLLPVCVYALLIWGPPSLYHDFPSLAVNCLVGVELLYLLYDNATPPLPSAFSILALIALSFLLKPLPAMTVACVPPFLLYLLHRRRVLTWRRGLGLFLLPLCAALLWCVRNGILSGYPLYPITLFPVDADWRMPEYEATGNALSLRGWARMPSMQYLEALEKGITFWFLPWLRNLMQQNLIIPVVLLPLCLGSVCWMGVRKRLRGVEPSFLLLWPALSLVYWFWLAPDPRYGAEHFWLFFAMGAACWAHYRAEAGQAAGASACAASACAASACAAGQEGQQRREGRWRAYYLAGLGLLMVGASLLLLLHPWRTMAWLRPGVVPPRPTEQRLVQHPEQPPFSVFVARQRDLCGDAPLPCVPVLHPALEMRKAGDMGAGYRLRQ